MTNGKPTAEDYKLAQEVADWMLSLNEKEQLNDFMQNLATFGKLGIVNPKGMGTVAAAINAFQRDTASCANAQTSDHFGVIGERLTLRLKLVGNIGAIDGQYGRTYIHKFVDESGNKFTWFGSSQLDKEEGFKQNDFNWAKATIKKHDNYKWVAETHLNRVALTEEPKAKKTRAKKSAVG